ncbi:hypothetical protein M2171_005164 [Bradyrhizobium japonicum USDA 38]|uniref:hypothetical protein n=1 Tax=Bradyrhizobium japonicum TaxID=375 RepID=UPI0003FF6F59|nr:hypothetical protein [Bradyrhizobium japonicum]MCS3896031.1 hypothetical protein [Bradyrhizobium japonicum USDA 38]MCS3948545.1 hypothetical protein [Bradyrhizobium japonicum]
MVKLSNPFSVAAQSISAAISEGRAEDALHALVRQLEAGDADKVVQALAARWIATLGLRPGDAKALRGGHKELLKEWLDIAEMVIGLQNDGETYERAVAKTKEHFGYTERHIQKCVAMRRAAQQD